VAIGGDTGAGPAADRLAGVPDQDQPPGGGEPLDRTRRIDPPEGSAGPPAGGSAGGAEPSNDGPPTQQGGPQDWFDDDTTGDHRAGDRTAGEYTRPYDPSADPTPGVVPGIVLDNRYRLEELLGRGATAEVYRGVDELLGRQVAIKVFHRGLSDPTTVARQRTEMQVLAKLHHPNLVTVYDAKLGVEPPPGAPPAADDSDLTYLVMELVQGGTLANRITPSGMAPTDVARIGAAVAGALAAVHSHGLVHRDVKPANILMSLQGDVKLSDFGIARELAAERLTSAVDVIGTAAYLSPEQARGAEVGPPTDVYALGLVLLEAMTGRREFPGQAVESAVARLLRDPVVPDSLPGSWPARLRAMTSPDPVRRPTAAQVEATLTGRGQVPVAPAPAATATLPQRVPPPPEPRKSNAGRTFAITLLILAVAALAVVGVVALIQRNSQTDTPTVPTPTSASSSAPPSEVTVTKTTTTEPPTTRTTPTTPSTTTTPSTSTTPTPPTPPPTPTPTK
jgi:serine/threonine protein kinase